MRNLVRLRSLGQASFSAALLRVRSGAFMRVGFLFSVALASDSALAQVFTFSSATLVPDGNISGIADVRSVSGVAIGSVPTVGLSLSGNGAGMLNGDLYVSLAHESAAGEVDAFAVLLNRVGKREDNQDGYFDNGLSVQFTFSPSAPDIHNYRLLLNGDHSIPLEGPLTGLWAPDGRNADPDLVLDSDSRSTGLGPFAAVDANSGRWVLFVADVADGGQARLDGWSLDFSVAIPEVPGAVSLASAALMTWAVFTRSARRRCREGEL